MIFTRSQGWTDFVDWIDTLPPHGTQHLRELGAESWSCDPAGLKMELNKYLAKVPANARAFAEALLAWLETLPKDYDVIVVQGGKTSPLTAASKDNNDVEIDEADLFAGALAANDLAVAAQSLVIQATVASHSGITNAAERLWKAARIKAYDTWIAFAHVGKKYENAGGDREIPMLLNDCRIRISNVWKVMEKVQARVANPPGDERG